MKPAHGLQLSVVLLLVLSSVSVAQEPLLDLIIAGGTVVDGTGAAPRRADVGIRGDRVVEIGDLEGRAAGRRIEAAGMVVAPGFIDVHAHADADAARHPEARNFLLMGVTTIITGNCGGSVKDLAGHLETVGKQGICLNYGSLLGHGTVRSAVMGREAREPDATQQRAMESLVREAMEIGAFGLSTGLIYVPGTYAKTEEIVGLAKVVARYGGVYASHMRNEGAAVLDAIDEAIRIGLESGARVHLSHLKASGKRNWGRGTEIIERIRKARADGLEVTGDQYAYTASSTSLDILFPSKELQVTRGKFGLRLKNDPEYRSRMVQALLDHLQETGFEDFDYCRIAHAPNNPELAGKTVAQVTAARREVNDARAQAEVIIDLYVESKGQRVGMVYHKMADQDVEAIMQAPFVGVASDAGIRVPGAARPHPRGSGNNPRVLGHFVRERKTIGLAEAVRKMTSLPADVFGLKDRGRLVEGCLADIVVFDPEKIVDRATYAEPFEPPSGLTWVLVNGAPVVEDGEHRGLRAGRVLRHRQPPLPSPR